MSTKITWVRPSGSEITTNGLEATIKRAAELGWKPKDEPQPEPAQAQSPQRGRMKRVD